MNDITALKQRLAFLMQDNSVPMSDSWGRLFDALQACDTENERMARDLISRNGEIEGLRKRVEELEEIATDYGMKFQRAQDDLKKMALMKSRAVTAAAADVLAERQRQVTAEGWTPEHDDEHSDGEMALAASSYALYAHKKPIAPAIPYNWPWEPEWFKQQGARRDLVKAGALILAEIERLDRAAGIKVIEGGDI